MKIKTKIKSGPGSTPCPNCTETSQIYYTTEILNYQVIDTYKLEY